MASQSSTEDENARARSATSGAQPGNSTNRSELPEPESTDLRDAPAQGGGGAGSPSSRSK
jgi:hypothetical protein